MAAAKQKLEAEETALQDTCRKLDIQENDSGLAEEMADLDKQNSIWRQR